VLFFFEHSSSHVMIKCAQTSFTGAHLGNTNFVEWLLESSCKHCSIRLRLTKLRGQVCCRLFLHVIPRWRFPGFQCQSLGATRPRLATGSPAQLADFGRTKDHIQGCLGSQEQVHNQHCYQRIDHRCELCKTSRKRCCNEVQATTYDVF